MNKRENKSYILHLVFNMAVPTIVTVIINDRVIPHIITGIFSDNIPRTLFEFYPDELSFTKKEFIGMTQTQAFRVKQTKDVAYLQS